MIRLMTAPTNWDELVRETEIVLRENRVALERSEHTAERLVTSIREYKLAMGDLLREAGIELPGSGTTARRSRGVI
jgi:hypothetical protein